MWLSFDKYYAYTHHNSSFDHILHILRRSTHTINYIVSCYLYEWRSTPNEYFSRCKYWIHFILCTIFIIIHIYLMWTRVLRLLFLYVCHCCLSCCCSALTFGICQIQLPGIRYVYLHKHAARMQTHTLTNRTGECSLAARTIFNDCLRICTNRHIHTFNQSQLIY